MGFLILAAKVTLAAGQGGGKMGVNQSHHRQSEKARRASSDELWLKSWLERCHGSAWRAVQSRQRICSVSPKGKIEWARSLYVPPAVADGRLMLLLSFPILCSFCMRTCRAAPDWRSGPSSRTRRAHSESACLRGGSGGTALEVRVFLTEMRATDAEQGEASELDTQP